MGSSWFPCKKLYFGGLHCLCSVPHWPADLLLGSWQWAAVVSAGRHHMSGQWSYLVCLSSGGCSPNFILGGGSHLLQACEPPVKQPWSSGSGSRPWSGRAFSRRQRQGCRCGEWEKRPQCEKLMPPRTSSGGKSRQHFQVFGHFPVLHQNEAKPFEHLREHPPVQPVVLGACIIGVWVPALPELPS